MGGDVPPRASIQIACDLPLELWVEIIIQIGRELLINCLFLHRGLQPWLGQTFLTLNMELSHALMHFVYHSLHRFLHIPYVIQALGVFNLSKLVSTHASL